MGDIRDHFDKEKLFSEGNKKSSYTEMEEINQKAMRVFKEHVKNIGSDDSEMENFNYPSYQSNYLSKTSPKSNIDNGSASTIAPPPEENKSEKSISLEEVLLSRGLIFKDQIDVALKQQKDSKNKRSLGEILVDLGFITDSVLAKVLAESSGIKSLDLKNTVLDVDLIRKIPKNIAKQYNVVPISLEDDKLHIAISDIYNIIAFDHIKKYFDKHIQIIPQYANETSISDAIEQYYEYEMKVEAILKEIEGEIEKGGVLQAEDQGYLNPTIRLVDAILFDAIRKQASDIHFEPENNFIRLRYRIDGQLIQVLTFHKDYWSAVLVRLKILSGLNIAETRSPQDGRISYSTLGRVIDFRVSSQPTVNGENIVARILDKTRALVTLEDLGLSEHNLKLLYTILKRPEGVIVVTGPTGSGKSTTLYSILAHINSIHKNIMTLEDPVEYQLPMIRQSGVKDGTGMNFADGIRSMMRQDPDVIFVGEVRDQDTANMTIRAAMTGHQVYTTLHTNDAVGAIPRLMDLGIRSTLLAGSIICIIAQRLARKLCMICKEEYTPSAEECKILGIDQNTPPKLFRHKGCNQCYESGYRGRVAIMEILRTDEEIDDMIARDASRKEILSYARANGMVSIDDDGIKKVLEGITDLEELINTINMTERMK